MRHIGSIGWRTVVSGGSVQFIRNESSKPTTDTSPGTLHAARAWRRGSRPGPSGRWRTRCRSRPPRSACAAPAWAPSIEYQERATWSGRERDARRASRLACAAATFRFDGTWSGGPASTPTRVWPSEMRWPSACSTATASSHETRGNPRPSIEAFTRTVGSAARRGGRSGRAARPACAYRPPANTMPDTCCWSRSSTYSASDTPPAVWVHRTGVNPRWERATPMTSAKRGEDRVLELGQHEADEARPLAAQLGRALVAQDVERGEDRLARGVRDAGLAVEHAAHRRLAHADLARHLGESSCHAVMLRKIRDNRLRRLTGASRRLAPAASSDACRCATTRSPRRPPHPQPVHRGRSCGCSARSPASRRDARARPRLRQGRAAVPLGRVVRRRAASASTSAPCSSARRSRGRASSASRDRLTFVQGDAGTYEPEPGAFDVASCIGATWIGGGLAGTIELLRPAIGRGGRILIGEPYWIEPPPDEAVEALGFGADELRLARGHARPARGGGPRARRDGARQPATPGIATRRAQWRTIAEWLAANPADPDHDGDARVPRPRPPQPTCAGAAATSAGASSSPARAEFASAPRRFLVRTRARAPARASRHLAPHPSMARRMDLGRAGHDDAWDAWPGSCSGPIWPARGHCHGATHTMRLS